MRAVNIVTMTFMLLGMLPTLSAQQEEPPRKDEAKTDVSVLQEGTMPVIEEVGAGETKRYRFAATPNRRYTVTLTTFTGDADLFAGYAEDISPQNAVLRSTLGPLQTERLFFTPDPKKSETIFVAVVGVTQSRYALTVTSTHLQLSASPEEPKVIKVRHQDLFGDPQHLITALTIENMTSVWYEVRLKCEGLALSKYGLTKSLLLGPRQQRLYTFVPFDAASKLTIHASRDTQAARIYLVCDVASRILTNGRPLSPDIADEVNAAIPKLLPLAVAAIYFQRGDWRGGGKQLVQILRRHPEVLTTLHRVLQKSGIRLSRDVLSGQLFGIWGTFSAAKLGLSAVTAPVEEEVTISLR